MSDNYDINDSTLFDGFFDENTLFQEVYGDDENDYAAIEKDYGGVKEEKFEEHDETSDSTISNSPKKPSILAEMLTKNSSSQNVQQQQKQQPSPIPKQQQQEQQQQHSPAYPINNYYYPPQYHHEAPAMQPPHMMQQRPSMNPPHFQQQYVYYPNYQMQQPHQNLIYHPNLPIQRYPYQQQQVYFQQQMPPPSQGHHPSRQMTIQQQQQPSFLPLYRHPQQQQHFQPQPFPQIPVKSILQKFEISDPDSLKTFEMPPTPSKLVISAVDKDESRSTRTLEPYKIAQSFHAKLRDRQVTGEAALLEINRLQFQRWHKCVEYVKSYLSTSHELIPFIVYLLENSASSNVCIQWKERTKKFEHDRAFEFKSKEEIAKAYFVVTGKETKYTNIITKLTRLCNTRFDGCPVFQKTKSRNTYEIFPTLIPSHDDTPCPVQIVNGLPVETDYI